MSLPTPLAVVLSFFEPDEVAAAWVPYERAMLAELAEILNDVP